MKRLTIYGVKYIVNNEEYKESVYFYNFDDAKKYSEYLSEKNKNITYTAFQTTAQTLLNYYRELNALDSKSLLKNGEKSDLMHKFGLINYKIYKNYNEFLASQENSGSEK